MRFRRSVMAAVAVVAVLLAGCSTDSGCTARFVRYEKLPDGTEVAVVAPVAVGADPSQVRALVKIRDLRPGELVSIESGGREWDQPQWMPSDSVAERLSRR